MREIKISLAITHAIFVILVSVVLVFIIGIVILVCVVVISIFVLVLVRVILLQRFVFKQGWFNLRLRVLARWRRVRDEIQ